MRCECSLKISLHDTGDPRYLRTFYTQIRLSAFGKMVQNDKLPMDFLSANSRFAVHNDGTYLLRITRETCIIINDIFCNFYFFGVPTRVDFINICVRNVRAQNVRAQNSTSFLTPFWRMVIGKYSRAKFDAFLANVKF